MPEETVLSHPLPSIALHAVERTFVTDGKGKFDGLKEGRLVETKKWGFAITARSMIKFVFQIIIWIFIYSIALGSLMIFKNNIPLYTEILMTCILLCGIGIGTSITLYLLYPHIAPRIFDFHHGFFYTKPLSFYIHIIAWDSVHCNITRLDYIQAIQLVRTENSTKNGRSETLDQTNLVLRDGRRIPLILQRNANLTHIQEDAQKLATRLIVPVWDMNIITI